MRTFLILFSEILFSKDFFFFFLPVQVLKFAFPFLFLFFFCEGDDVTDIISMPLHCSSLPPHYLNTCPGSGNLGYLPSPHMGESESQAPY